MSVFKYLDYKKYIENHLKSSMKRRGYKAQLAEAAGCQRSFFSQVLNSHQNLTLEQGFRLCRFWQLSEGEEEYFMIILIMARAGDHGLQNFWKAKAEKMREQQKDLSKRYQQKDITQNESSQLYYSSWHYAAIHMLISTNRFNSVQAIGKRLGLGERTVDKAVRILKTLDLVEGDINQLRCTINSIHLPKSSHLNTWNHTQWRQKVLHDLPFASEDELHYSAIYSLSLNDIDKVRKLLLEFIDQSRKVAMDTVEEDIVGINCDFFNIKPQG